MLLISFVTLYYNYDLGTLVFSMAQGKTVVQILWPNVTMTPYRFWFIVLGLIYTESAIF